MISHRCLVLDVVRPVSLIQSFLLTWRGEGRPKGLSVGNSLVCKDFYASFLLYSVNMMVCDQFMRVCSCNLRPHPTQE
jgi:hypothetical protein